MKKTFISALIICALASCNNPVEPTELKRESAVSQFGDSIYLSPAVMCMDYFQGHLYVSDQSDGIYVFDRNFEPKEHFARKGYAKGESLENDHFYISPDGALHLINCGHISIDKYVDGIYKDGMKLPSEHRLSASTRFFFLGDTLYHSIVGEDNYVLLRYKDKTLKEMCKGVEKYDDSHKPLHSERHLIRGEESFFVIGISLPIFQEYSFDGELLGSYDLTNIPEIKEEYYANKSDDPKSFVVLIPDVQYSNGKVYLLFSRQLPSYSCNTLVVIDTHLHDYRHTATYRLPEEVYSTFCITDNNECIAFECAQSALEKYILPKM